MVRYRTNHEGTTVVHDCGGKARSSLVRKLNLFGKRYRVVTTDPVHLELMALASLLCS